MRTLIISFAAAASALAVASPAAAQWGAPGYQGQGYYNGQSQVRLLQNRVQQLRNTIVRYDRSNRLTNREARRLDRHAVELQRRIGAAAYRGLTGRERFDIERRIEDLRQAIRYEVRDSNRWGWNGHDNYNNGYGYYGQRRRNDDRYGRGHGDDDRRYRGDDYRDDRRDDRREDRRDDRRNDRDDRGEY